MKGQKITFKFNELFWATFFILLGVSIGVKAFWGINIPIFKFFIAAFMIYLGISILFSPNGKQRSKRRKEKE